jgi:hypothetical protein
MTSRASTSRAAWRTSSYSGANGNCVQIARPAPDTIAVRDSHDPGGPRLTFTPGALGSLHSSRRTGNPLDGKAGPGPVPM